MHVEFTDAVNGIVRGHWGQGFDTEEDARKALIDKPEELAAYALIELLNRLNAVAKAVGGEIQVNRTELSIPNGARQFPDKEVGDFLYSGSLDEDVCEYIVVARNDDGVCLVILADDFDLNHPQKVCIAYDWLYTTIEELLQSEAESDIVYHGARLEYAKAALAAVKNGEDLTPFLGGFVDSE